MRFETESLCFGTRIRLPLGRRSVHLNSYVYIFMDFKTYFKSVSGSMNLLGPETISENLKYHIDNKISLCENIFRVYSKAYFNLIKEVRNLYNKNLIELNDEDAELVETSIGEIAEYKGKKVYLDAPKNIINKINEAEHAGKQVALNKPTRTPGGPKKFKVYVRTPGGKIKMVRFGDSKSSGLSIKNNNAARAKSFRARHKCSEKKDKTTPGYWSCNVARYAKSLGLKSNRPW